MGFTVFQISVSIISDQRLNIRSKGQSNDLTKCLWPICPVGSLFGSAKLVAPSRWFSWRGFSDKLLTGVCPEEICTVGSGIILWRSVVFQACLSEDVVLKIAAASLWKMLFWNFKKNCHNDSYTSNIVLLYNILNIIWGNTGIFCGLYQV